MSRVAKLILVYLGAGVVLAGFSVMTLIVMAALAGGLDVAHELGIGDRPVNLIALSGGLVAAGLFFARLLKASGAWLVVAATWLPAIVAQWVAWMILDTVDLDTETLVIGAVSLAIGQFVAVNTTQSRSMYAAPSTSGLRGWMTRLWGVLAGGILMGIALGVLTGLTITDVPAGPPELYLVIDDYSVDASTGECSGSGEVSGVIADSRLLISDAPLPEEAEEGEGVLAVVLPAGKENSDIATGCLFALGDPLELEVQDYATLSYWHESDPNVGQGTNVEDHRIFISLSN